MYLTSETIQNLDADVRRFYTYKSEPRDNWRSFHRQVAERQAWSGDCDDLVSTALQVMRENGCILERLFRAQVSTFNDKHADHTVGLVRDEEDHWWVVGDSYGEAHRLEGSPHRILLISCLAEGLAWHDAVVQRVKGVAIVIKRNPD